MRHFILKTVDGNTHHISSETTKDVRDFLEEAIKKNVLCIRGGNGDIAIAINKIVSVYEEKDC